MERPMAALGFSFFLSLVIASFLELKMTVALAALCFVAFLTALCISKIRQNRAVLTVVFAALAAFSMYSGQEMLTYRPLQKWDGKTAYLKIETLENVQHGNTDNVTVRVIEGDIKRGTRLTLWLPDDIYPAPYDILSGEFMLSTPSDSLNGKIRGYSKSNKVFLNAWPAEYGGHNIKVIPPEKPPFIMHKVLQARRYTIMTIMSLPSAEDVAGLMAGLAFGFDEKIPSDIAYNFRHIGVSHLLAVSGLHVALLSQALLRLLVFIRMPRRAASAVTGGVVLFFMALTGFSPSVMRAGIMCLLLLAGMVLGREPDSLNSLGFAVLAITLFNPYAVNDAGLLLSFAATFGLLSLYPMFSRFFTDKLKSRWQRFLYCPCNAAAITVAATVPTLPVILLTFGSVALISPLSNFLMVMPATVVMIATCVAVPLYAFAPLRFAANAAFWVAEHITRYLVAVSRWLASLPLASVNARQSYLLLLVPAATGLIILGGRWFGRRGVRVTALWSIIALLCGMLTYNVFMRGVTSIEVLKSGNATAVLVEHSGRTGVVMMGGQKSVSASLYAIKRRNLRGIDFLIMPSLDDECVFSSMILTDEIGVDCLVCGAPGKYSDTIPALKTGRRINIENNTISLWDDCKAFIMAGWLCVDINKTRLLIAPDRADASMLSADRRRANLVVYTGSVPRHAELITAQVGVVSCDTDTLLSVVREIPAGIYHVYNTAIGDVTAITRGKGDIEVR